MHTVVVWLTIHCFLLDTEVNFSMLVEASLFCLFTYLLFCLHLVNDSMVMSLNKLTQVLSKI